LAGEERLRIEQPTASDWAPPVWRRVEHGASGRCLPELFLFDGDPSVRVRERVLHAGAKTVRKVGRRELVDAIHEAPFDALGAVRARPCRSVERITSG